MALTGEFFRILVRRLVRLFPYSEFVASNSSKVRRAQLPRETETSAILDGPLKMTSPALTRARAPDILRAILPAQQLRQLGDVHGDSCK